MTPISIIPVSLVLIHNFIPRAISGSVMDDKARKGLEELVGLVVNAL